MSHLFFADDSLLFCQANDNDCQSVLDILDTYEQASGQQINQVKLNCFSAQTQSSPSARKFQICLEFRRFPNMKNIWVFHPLLGEQRSKVLASSEREFGVKSKGGKKNFCLKPVVKSSSNQSFKQCQHSLWGVSSSPRAFVRILNH